MDSSDQALLRPQIQEPFAHSGNQPEMACSTHSLSKQILIRRLREITELLGAKPVKPELS